MDSPVLKWRIRNSPFHFPMSRRSAIDCSKVGRSSGKKKSFKRWLCISARVSNPTSCIPARFRKRGSPCRVEIPAKSLLFSISAASFWRSRSARLRSRTSRAERATQRGSSRPPPPDKYRRMSTSMDSPVLKWRIRNGPSQVPVLVSRVRISASSGKFVEKKKS